MIGSTRQVAVYAYAAPADLRKGYEGLSALVRRELRAELLDGDLFLFVSRTRKRAKVLFWDGTGLCLFAKRLEKNCFAALWREGDVTSVALTMSELQLFLEGSVFVGRIPLSPEKITARDLVPRARSV